MLTSGWKTATFGDGTKFSTEVDLGNHYNKVLIIVSDLDTDTHVNVQVSNVSGSGFVNLYNLYLATPADITIPKSKACVVPIAGARYLKVAATATVQTTTRTSYFIGVPW